MAPMKRALIGLLCLLATPAVAETIRVATPTLPASLVNPFRTIAPPSIYVYGALFDALTRFDHEGRLKPWLATAWERESPTSWLFDLRQDVSFSNSEPFDAEAVVTTVAFLTSDAAVLEGVRREMEMVVRAEAIGPYRVRLVTNRPVPLLPRFVAAMPIVAPKHFTKVGLAGFMRAPVGTGPFQLKNRTSTRLELSAFAQGWRKPRAPGVVFTAVPTPSARVAGLQSEVFDIALDLGPEEVLAVEAGGDKSDVTISSSVTGISFFLTRPGPFSDIRVRKALNMAVDRQRIIDTLLAGKTRPSSQPATPTALGYDPAIPVYPYDPAKAKALLAEAGFADGLTFTMETSVGYAPADAAIFQRVAQDLKAVGVDMRIDVVPTQEYLTRRTAGKIKAEAFAAEWPAWPVLDSLRALRMHSCWRRPIAWYCHEALSARIEAALVEENADASIAMRKEIMRAYHDEAPALFLFEAPQFTGLRQEVAGYRDDANLIAWDEITVTP
jgi:peptide/nickel transport system substrate-binding protein